MDEVQFERIAKALADPTRFAVLESIAADDEVSCSALAESCAVTMPTVSHHLKELAVAGLLEARREARFVYYRFRRDTAAAYLGELQRRLRTEIK
ncbi:MAG: metalloregulator ArsR/SmtB family transcription factor [Bryobacteraceae bacterium]|nr:metalloregulator ArsR/SmtB family transcription factor [Bryobacteraceae bacterium]